MYNQNSIASYVLDNMTVAVILLDKNLCIKYINQSTQQLFRISSKRILEKNITQAFDYTNFDFARLKNCLSLALGYTDYEVTFVVDGSPIITEISVTPLETKEEFFNSALLLEIKKIDQQKKLNQEIIQHSQQIAARDLVRGLAHEIKNPLGGIRGAAQLLERLFKNENEVKEYTSVIIEQADRLKHLVDKLLGPQKAVPHELHNIHEVLEKVLKLISMDLASNIKLVKDYDPSIPEILMNFDQLQQAILNIICNAAIILKDYKIPNGLITIKTRTVYRISIHGKIYKTAIQISITDNGPGIPPEIIDTVFYPMVTRRSGGTGLGLSISQNIIDQHHGKIESTSWIGHTEFSIFLPLKE